jgi:phage terminase small subunit
MAGVKGRSGGARQGTGPKPAKPTPVTPEAARVVHGEPLDPRPTLELVAMGHMEVSPQQFKALTALLPYMHTKKGDGGKKDEKQDAAKKAGAGRFGASSPPRLVSNRG